VTEKIDRLKYSKIMYLYLEELVLQSEGKPLMQGNARCREELVKKKIAFASRVIQDVHKNRVTREIKRQTM